MTSTRIPREDFEKYPLLSRLLELHDIPKCIYLKGTLPHVTFDEYGRATPRILTIVGSRKHSTYGVLALEKILQGIGLYDVVIVSGLALGIDEKAHALSLKHSRRTIAIPGSGLSQKVLYPKKNIHLAEKIIEEGGVLLSELEDTTAPAPWTFPSRNRIMAALSDAVLVVEAEEKSGTLITARQSLELGRDIGAIPGDIFSPTSHGTNLLIKDGAYPITSLSDLISLLHLSHNDTNEEKGIPNLSSAEEKLLDLLFEPKNKDQLFNESSMTYEDFISVFSSLEIQGYVDETFGEVRRLV